ncbi:MAG TPA: ATP-binding cassette domain-containing protein [Solirubrobacteraceae bacterium]|jgi:predicted ABC-type transport system involved in lysophospholipase L1 biosynthesis ATPase subunit|nr:ATP-binding cassette domain-containing protein [Solirubrobacteraceae bacterium]
MDPVLSLRGVSLSFPRGRRHVVRVLADVSLDLHAGESVAVLARRSQGKTSLLRVAAGIERPDRGSVTFAGEDVWRLSDRRRSRLLGSEIGLVERAAPHLDVPVLTGVALPLLDRHGRRGAYARAKSALAHVGASECARQRWGELADSERALVALAHGIAREPRLLLVDDLAATLGIEEHADIAELLGALAAERGIAMLVCAGDSGPTPNCDRVASFAGGELLVAPAAPTDGTNVLDFPGEHRRRALS